MTLQPIMTDSGDFPKIRENRCVYVDKTAYFHRLASGADSCFFLARPRRFGKSLMIRTLQALFEGRRELFEGLAISKTDWQWNRWPVIYFNFGFAASASADIFARQFPLCVKNALVAAGFKYEEDQPPTMNFGAAIEALNNQNQGKGVVILIDEYDDPVAQLLDKPEEAERVRGTLADFYRQMKDRTGAIRFLMITGVSKFTKMSVFSALSNLVDLSFKDECATMLGFTEQELDTYFTGHMRAHAERMGLQYDTYRAELKRWFNGYRFGRHSAETVYNPVSIVGNLAAPEPEFRCGWAETGKASMLMDLLGRETFAATDLERLQAVREADFDVSDIRRLRLVPMLYQTGYLTINHYNPFTRSYDLCVPDEEVRQDLATVTAAAIAGTDTSWVSSLGLKLLLYEWPSFFDGLKALYAGLPYGATEGNIQAYSFERTLVVLLKSQGIQVISEERQADGQADVVAVHPCGVYIFELKVDRTAEEALAQIREKHYAAPYRADSRPVWLVGLSFDRGTRQLLDAKAEKA